MTTSLWVEVLPERIPTDVGARCGSPEVQPAVQQLGVAEGDETVAGDGQGRPQSRHLGLFVVEVRLPWRDGLELDEPSEPVDLVEMEADPFPDQQAAHLADDAEGLLERAPRARPVIDPGQSVLALRSTLLLVRRN